jgi:hypothetical protein
VPGVLERNDGIRLGARVRAAARLAGRAGHHPVRHVVAAGVHEDLSTGNQSDNSRATFAERGGESLERMLGRLAFGCASRIACRQSCAEALLTMFFR